MQEDESRIITKSAQEVGLVFSLALDMVRHSNTRMVIEEDGTPVAALISIDDFNRLLKPPTFTPRQSEVFKLIAQGLKGPEIAARMTVVLKTVEYHTYAVLTKMRATTALQAVLQGIDLGILDLDELTRPFDLESARRLTRQELKILEEMVQDPRARPAREDTASSLHIGIATVDFHMTNAFRKLGVGNRIQAALVYEAAKRNDIINPPQPQIP